MAYYSKLLGRSLSGSEVLYPENISKNDEGETLISLHALEQGRQVNIRAFHT